MTTGVRIFEKETLIPASPGHRNLIEHSKNAFEFKDAAALPVRFAISRLDDVHYQCELGVLEGIDTYAEWPKFSLFDFPSFIFSTPVVGSTRSPNVNFGNVSETILITFGSFE